jgi:hypothetical protein
MKAVPMLLTALSLGAGAAIAGCTDPATTAPAAPAVEVPIGNTATQDHNASPSPSPARTEVRNGGLVSKCRPLAPLNVHRVIGPAGGTLAIGPHTLTIPPGALSRHVNIRAKIGGKSVNVIELKPDWLVFEAPAVLTMSYANCDREGRTNALRIAVVNETLGIVDYVSSSDDAATQTVTGSIPDFSNYAVAW